MSFETNPFLYTFDGGPSPCTTCYPANKTPTSLFCSIQGIEIGDTWSSAIEPPPNGVFELTYDNSCQWSFASAPLTIFFKAAFPDSSLVVSLTPGGFVFTDTIGANCEFEFENFWQSPIGRNYFGGKIILLNPLQSGPFNNIDLMELLNLDPEGDFFASFATPDPDFITMRYSRSRDRSNIHIKYDLT